MSHVVVVGAGAMGLAAAWQLARRGQRVTILEQFEPGHLNGASHGITRNFNNAYSQLHYVDLLGESLRLWRDLEEQSGMPLLQLHGLVTHGDDLETAQIKATLDEHGFDSQMLSATEAAARWRGMRFEHNALLTAQGGVIWAESALQVLQGLAEADGAVIRHGVRVHAIEPSTDGVSVRYGAGEVVQADHVVVAAGAWASKLLTGIVDLPPLRVTEEQPAHFVIIDDQARWPSFNHLDAPTGLRDGSTDPRKSLVYGMETPGQGLKVGMHRVGPVVDPDERTYRAAPHLKSALVDYVRQWYPGVDADRSVDVSCTYTSTASGDFVLDTVGPVTVAAGFAGHGFKFVPAVGRILADSALGVAVPPAIFHLG